MPLSPPPGPTNPLIEQAEKMLVASQLYLQSITREDADGLTIKVYDPRDGQSRPVTITTPPGRGFRVRWHDESGLACGDHYPTLRQAVAETLFVMIERRIYGI